MRLNKSVQKIPNQLCQQIFNYEFELDIGNITEDTVAKTIQLYAEALNFFLARAENSDINKKKSKFYQDKIKRLLARNDIQKCLMGKKTNSKGVDLQHKLQEVHENAQEQSKALISYFKNQLKNQQKLIKKTVEQQNQSLNERIARRSKSKRKLKISPGKKNSTISNCQ